MTSPTSQDVLERLHALMSQFKRRMHQAVRDQGDGLAPMEARALAYFTRHPGHTQSELVQHAGRDKAQIARIVKQLLDRGLLRSEPDPADGRSQLLQATEQGAAMQRLMDRHRRRFEADLLKPLSAAEREALRDCLDRMLAGVSEGSRPGRAA